MYRPRLLLPKTGSSHLACGNTSSDLAHKQGHRIYITQLKQNKAEFQPRELPLTVMGWI